MKFMSMLIFSALLSINMAVRLSTGTQEILDSGITPMVWYNSE
jgi:hypothetical protein